ncbi:hypothetical protein CVT24_011822 [Panaeolus cyanescens]|uniref:Uncharacterized protein n=1 Tax=Panaeolus cyanescens TaxID=181874 RepID=A0A409VH62_9AGAR|nr:hypothetical protein CVT24_011822 [Panaeolus cyanescens]
MGARDKLLQTTLFDIHHAPEKGNNDLPSEDALKTAKVSLASHSADLCDVERTIKVLSIAVKALQGRACDLNEKITTCHQILSPIRRLPDDVFGEIFQHFAQIHGKDARSASFAPLVLSAVCRKWRIIASSIPQVWKVLNIHCIRYDHEGGYNLGPLTTEGVMTWLSRSTDHPFSLRISYERHSHPYLYAPDFTSIDEFRNGFKTLARLLAQHVHRWMSLSFLVPNLLVEDLIREVILQSNEKETAHAFSVLRKFQMHCTEFGSLDNVDQAYMPILSAPTLRNLALYGLESHLANVGWETLTRLSLHMCIHRHTVLNILRHCKVLEACAVHIVYIPAELPPPNIGSLYESHLTVDDPREVTLPNLTTLCIQGEIDDEANICGRLRAPALQHFLFYPTYRNQMVDYSTGWHLHFRYTSHPPLPPIKEIDVPRSASSPMCMFLSRCSALETLTINPAYLIGTDIIDMFQSCSAITKLVID